MKIDFSAIKEEKVGNLQGGEGFALRRMYDDGTSRIMHMELEKGASVGYHIHDKSCEIIYVLEGSALVKYDDESYTIESGMVEYCPRNHSHSITNLKDEVFVAVAIVFPL